MLQYLWIIYLLYVENMTSKSKSFFALTMDDVEDLEENLINHNRVLALDKDMHQMETIFLQNKILQQMIKEERALHQAAKQNVKATKKRIKNIKQLENHVAKQTNMMIIESQKIKDALRLNRILMMEKIVRMEREAEELRRKKEQCNRIKTEKQNIGYNTKLKASQKLERIKLQSLNNSFNLRNELKDLRCHTTEMKKRQADEVKQCHQRQRMRSMKIENYKRERARQNFICKLQDLKDDIFMKEEALKNIIDDENKQEIKAEATEKVSNEYLQSFFPTQDSNP